MAKGGHEAPPPRGHSQRIACWLPRGSLSHAALTLTLPVPTMSVPRHGATSFGGYGRAICGRFVRRLPCSDPGGDQLAPRTAEENGRPGAGGRPRDRLPAFGQQHRIAPAHRIGCDGGPLRDRLRPRRDRCRRSERSERRARVARRRNPGGVTMQADSWRPGRTLRRRRIRRPSTSASTGAQGT